MSTSVMMWTLITLTIAYGALGVGICQTPLAKDSRCNLFLTLEVLLSVIKISSWGIVSSVVW